MRPQGFTAPTKQIPSAAPASPPKPGQPTGLAPHGDAVALDRLARDAKDAVAKHIDGLVEAAHRLKPGAAVEFRRAEYDQKLAAANATVADLESRISKLNAAHDELNASASALKAQLLESRQQ